MQKARIARGRPGGRLPRGAVAGLLAVALMAVGLVACGPAGGGDSGTVSVHYLGHASFLLTFGQGPTVLTDYGESNAYGLDSPVHPLGPLVPEIVTLSHRHADHAGGALPDGVSVVLGGEETLEAGEGTLAAGGLTITPIPTYEGSLEAPDNLSFLFEFQGRKILHLGDCQGLMVALSGDGPADAREDVESLIRTLYPHRYDLVLLPIGFVSEILEEAADFVSLLDANRVVPMHYWTPGDRDAFLDLMEGRRDRQGRPYRVRREAGAGLTLAEEAGPQIIGLTPGPPGRD